MREPLRNGWKSIESAPFDQDVTLEVTDGRGEPYTLNNPCKLTAAGWVSSGKGYAAGGDAAAVEAVLSQSASRSMTAAVGFDCTASSRDNRWTSPTCARTECGRSMCSAGNAAIR
jgi:hypothetical protein